MLKIINLGVMGSLRILRRSFRFFFSKKASFSYKDYLSELTPVQSFSRGYTWLLSLMLLWTVRQLCEASETKETEITHEEVESELVESELERKLQCNFLSGRVKWMPSAAM